MQRFKAIFDFSPSRPTAAEAAGHTFSAWRGTSSAAQRLACKAPKLRPRWQAGAPPPAPRRRLPFSPRLLRPAPRHAPAAALVDKHIMSPRGGDYEGERVAGSLEMDRTGKRKGGIGGVWHLVGAMREESARVVAHGAAPFLLLQCLLRASPSDPVATTAAIVPHIVIFCPYCPERLRLCDRLLHVRVWDLCTPGRALLCRLRMNQLGPVRRAVGGSRGAQHFFCFTRGREMSRCYE